LVNRDGYGNDYAGLPASARTRTERCPSCGRTSFKKHLFEKYWMCQLKECKFRSDDYKPPEK